MIRLWGILAVLCLVAGASAADPLPLVINEFMARNDAGLQDPAGDYDDWIEIYNPADQSVDIGGMYLTDRLSNPTKWQIPSDLPAQTTIAAHGYLLVWADGEENEGGLHAGFKLNDEGEAVGLYDTTGTLVDSIAFGPQNPDQSYGRFPDGIGTWQVFGDPTPGQPNEQDHADVVISEIMYHPYAEPWQPEDTGLEYIELFNRGAAPVLLKNWQITEGVRFTFPSVTLNGGAYLVVAADADAFARRYPDVGNLVGGWDGRLSNSGETVELYDDAGTVVDSVRYAEDGDWAVRELGPVDRGHRGWLWRNDHDGGGKSLELVNAALPNEYGPNWAASDPNGGTPGVANSVATADSAPLIGAVSHVPVVPGPVDPVIVTARVVDESSDGLDVYLYYRIDRSEYLGVAVYPTLDVNDYTVVSMFDDGAHGDGLARDGVYGVEVPPHPDGVVIEFYIQARDKAGHSRTWPAPSRMDGEARQVTNALYRVDAAFNPYAYWQIGSQPLYYMVMAEAERGRLAYLGSRRDHADSHAQMNGTFISVDGQDILLRYNVGIRNRGNGSRLPPPNNYHVNFPKDRLWKGVSAININSKYTYIQLLGHTVFHMAGLPALDAKRVQVRVNGQDLALMDPERMYGSYVHLEVYDSDWAENHLPDDRQGNLYRGVSRSRYCDLRYRGEDPAVYGQEDRYGKKTNTAANDWSDLIALTYVLDEAPDETYVQDVEAVVNVDQWLRWFALMALMTNRETNLSSGYGDDYCMYRGAEDTRFMLLPYDLDSVLTSSDPSASIWLGGRLDRLPVIERFLTHPEFVPRYYAQLKDLAETVLTAERFNPLIEQVLGGWVPDQKIAAIEDFVVARRAYVLSVIPASFTTGSDLGIEAGYHLTDLPYAFEGNLYGTADAVETRSVLINGQFAKWWPREGQWTLGAIMLDLFPGINRVIVEAFDGPDGTGRRLAQGCTDIYYRTEATNDYPQMTAAGTWQSALTEDTVWTAQEGPYRVMADLTVPPEVTLTIESGTTVFFDPNVTMTVQGRLVAEGTEYELIRFTRTPEFGGTWGGLQFVNSPQDNRICYAVLEYGQTMDGMVGLENSRILLDHVTLDHAELRRIRTIDSSLVVRHSRFTNIFEPGVPPTTDNRSEHIWGSGVPEDGVFIIEANVFGITPGHNDAIDFDGAARPGAIPQFLNNVFTGGGDDALDLETDAHIEGNVFMNYVKDRFNTSPRESNVISAGAGRDYVVVRNVFHHVQHVAQIKERSFMRFDNNTVVDANAAVLYFEIQDEDGSDNRFFGGQGQGVSPGRGVAIDSCIFWDCAALLDAFYVDDPEWGTTDITLDRSLVSSEWHALGEDNVDAAPLFVGPEDFHLQAISLARGTGRCGLDRGAYVPTGASVADVPSGRTYRTDVTLQAWGPGITHYKYSVNSADGPWSDERTLDTPISLAGLRDGDSYTVYVLGKNSAGIWQTQPNASPTWTVDTTYRRLLLNEILAANETAYEHDGSFPDMVELYYEGPEAINLAGMRLSDDVEQPDRFVFPAGVTMNPGDYLILWGDGENTTSDLHLGFGLDAKGDELYLYDRDGSLIDLVVFGHQLPDLSIGRTGPNSGWRLTIPTFGEANVVQGLGDPAAVRINEWLAGAEVLFVHDFIELFNPGARPVDLGGYYLTDNPTSQPDKREMRPLNFVSPWGFAVFEANEDEGPDHVSLGLSTDGEMIGLFDPNRDAVDKIIYGPQTPDVSQGRAPDGADELEWFPLPTPGVANPVVLQPVIQYMTLVSEEADKRAIVPLSEDHVGETWKSDPLFDDTSWIGTSGAPGGVGYERGSGYGDLIGLDIESEMVQVNTTCYVRIPFDVDATLAGSLSGLLLSVRYDDAYVAYLNGVEVARDNFVGVPRWDSNAPSSHEASSFAFDAVLDLSSSADLLHEGGNLLAIQLLNSRLTSSDLILSVVLEATLVEFVGQEHPYLKELQLLDGLRVTELMYHSQEGDEADYIELQNTGDVPLDLTGLRFTDGIQFTFPAMTLEPGQHTVVADDAARFGSVHGTDVPLSGEYSDHLSDRGEVIVLRLPIPWEAAIVRFRYEDDWYPSTDGDGQSLVIEEVTAASVTWNDPKNWRPAPPGPGQP